MRVARDDALARRGMSLRDVVAALFAACACYAASKRASHARFEPYIRFDSVDASVAVSSYADARALPTPAFDGDRFVFFARGVNATTIARATLAEDDGDASSKISRRRRRRRKNDDGRRRRRSTRVRDEDDAVRARGMRALAKTAVGREMDGFEEVDADAVRASVAAKSSTGVGVGDGDDQRAVVIERGRLAGGRRVVVVVTRDFRVVCFDDALRELWRREDAAPAGTRATATSVVVSSSGAATGDVGLIVVGARLEKVATKGRRTTGGANGVEEEAREDDSRGEFEYRAFDATTGETRWSETYDEDGHRRHETGRMSLKNLDGDEIEDAAERSCADFRESLVHDGLPHQWRHESDTRMRLAHFTRHKSRAEIRAREKRSRRRKSAPVASIPTNGARRAFGTAFDALRGIARERRRAEGARERREEKPPNVVVSHHSEGVEVLHLYSGAKVCGMRLKSPGLHVDFDGDGVVDRVEAHGWNAPDVGMPRCWATVTAGLTEERRTLSASICRGGSGLAAHRATHSEGHDIRSVEVAPPISLRRLPETSNELSKPRDQLGRDLVFLNNRGEMTCFNARDGEQRRWQIRTTADWTKDDVAHPSLAAFTAHVGGHVDLAVAVGSRSIVFVNAKGYRASPPIEITTPPTAPLLATDVDGDGLTDIVLRTQFSIYVWLQRPRSGNLPFTFLIGALATTMAVAFAHQLREARDADGYILRSTDVDGLEWDKFSDRDDDNDSDDDDHHGRDENGAPMRDGRARFHDTRM